MGAPGPFFFFIQSKGKLFHVDLPRQVIELIMEFIFGLKVSLNCRNLKTKLMVRGNTVVSQGSMEGMGNFRVYSDNINHAISYSVVGIMVGKETVRGVIYSDDILPINSSPEETNAALQAISTAGIFNAFKFKPSECKIIGSDKNFEGSHSLGYWKLLSMVGVLTCLSMSGGGPRWLIPPLS